MDDYLLLYHRPQRSEPGGLAATHFLYLQTPTSVSCHPLGRRPFGIQPCHRPDTRICAHLGPLSFCRRSSVSPCWILQSRPPYFMAWPGGHFRQAHTTRLFVSRGSDLIEEIPILPLASTDLVVLPLSRMPSVTYQALRVPLRQSLLADWSDLCPPVPLSYPYSASLTPHAFTGLPRFICGRIHQMPSGASYLAAHVSWRNRASSTLCPFFEEDDESFQHAILHCPTKAHPRLTHLSRVDDIGPDGPLWLSVPLFQGFAEYLNATRTGFPPTMLRIQANTATPEPGSDSDSA